MAASLPTPITDAPPRRCRAVVAIAAIALFGLAGCSPVDQGAVTLGAGTSRPALVVVLCDGEGIEAVRLAAATSEARSYEEGKTLWRIEATKLALDVQTFVVGETPEGFVETVPFADADLPEKMVLASENGGDGAVRAEHGGYFETGELQAGVLIQDGHEVSRSSLRSSADINCTSSFFGSFGLPEWLDKVAVAGLAVGLVVGVARWFSRR